MTRGFLSDEPARKSDLIDVAIEVRRETEKAICVFDGAKEVWLPKSLIERDGKIVTLPEWLAMERGLI